ncbi:RagB/SusD family nutrient uptake outer membrane protein [Prevotella sp. 10(H)]|uniref:RagB/SusD family nutrient uptake outer membrane protein n=1 Tax=Prevotella sp. 10(H) TaxID=1158294 RepID=UPI0004A6E9D0|nr:RagB/SusD family nutrient uptake outer membrane protein [Prevotella sp. 10(H)]
MNNIRYHISYFIAILLSVFMYSCSDFLDTESRNTLTEPTQWASEKNADVYLNGIYSTLNKPSTPDPLDSFTDDNNGGPYWASWQWKQGIATPEIRGGHPMIQDGTANDFMNWGVVYERVRKCNEFLEQVEAHKGNFSQEWINKRIDEVRFLRAYFYAGLWQHLGGVIILTETLDRNTMTEEQLYRKRNTFEETYNFISDELGEIVTNGHLDVKYNKGDANAGRATLGSALALKGWVDLYAASPGFNAEVPVAAEGTGATAEQVKLVGFGNYDIKRWQKAATTNKQFITLYKGTYELFDDMSKFWSEATEYNSEIIWDRQLERNISGLSTDFAQKGGPTYVLGKYYTWGNFCPTQELVDEFCMANGLPINHPDSKYDAENPYKDREQRFYDFIVYDGAPYKMNWMEKEDIIYTRIDKVNPSKNQIELGQSDVTRTGYYFKKRMDPDWEPTGAGYGINYVFFRYAEVLLNYAEAQNEGYGPDEVYDVINELRTMRGLPTLEDTYGGKTLNKDKMREVIHRERRVELCFENKRFYDLVRWRIAYDVLNKELHGMKIYNTQDDNSGKWVYERLPLTSHPHIFHQKMYLCPIPYSVITANSKIIQNPGY